MKEIDNIPKLAIARNAEHYQFHFDVSAVLTAELAEAQGIGDLQKAYAELFAAEAVCLLFLRLCGKYQ